MKNSARKVKAPPLPALPNPKGIIGSQGLYSGEQLQDYARACVEASIPPALFAPSGRKPVKSGPGTKKGGTRSSADEATIAFLIRDIKTAGKVLQDFQLHPERMIDRSQVLAFRLVASTLSSAVHNLDRFIGALDQRVENQD